MACALAWHHGVIQAWAAVKGCVWVSGSNAARVYVEMVHGSCCHRKLYECLGSGYSPKYMLVAEGHAVARDMQS